jgi:hypothetical protein
LTIETYETNYPTAVEVIDLTDDTIVEEDLDTVQEQSLDDDVAYIDDVIIEHQHTFVAEDQHTLIAEDQHTLVEQHQHTFVEEHQHTFVAEDQHTLVDDDETLVDDDETLVDDDETLVEDQHIFEEVQQHIFEEVQHDLVVQGQPILPVAIPIAYPVRRSSRPPKPTRHFIREPWFGKKQETFPLLCRNINHTPLAGVSRRVKRDATELMIRAADQGCAICSKFPIPDIKDMYLTSCGHGYCKQCLKAWDFTLFHTPQGLINCPMCRCKDFSVTYFPDPSPAKKRRRLRAKKTKNAMPQDLHHEDEDSEQEQELLLQQVIEEEL